MDFMDGVTFIKECMQLSTTGLIMTYISTLITAAFSLALVKIGYVLDNKTLENIHGLIGSILALVVAVIGTIITLKVIPNVDKCQEPNGKYEVVISGNIDMSEFQNRYDIINYKNGKYIIKIKES